MNNLEPPDYSDIFSILTDRLTTEAKIVVYLNMQVVSWNVNSVRARLPRLLAFLRRHEPDVVCLQEIKVTDNEFPLTKIEATGYQVLTYGQQAYNGVAFLIRDLGRRSTLTSFGTDDEETSSTNIKSHSLKPDGITRGFADNPLPEEARVISACVGGFRIVNVYVVNGGPMNSERFRIKGKWMTALGEWIRDLSRDPPVLVLGDFNVAPDDRDVWDPEGLHDRIHCTDKERKWLRKLQGDRLTDLLRATDESTEIYTWWPYQDDAFESNEGLRFDLALGDRELIDKVRRIWVDIDERDPSTGKGKPSDHAPLIVDFEL